MRVLFCREHAFKRLISGRIWRRTTLERGGITYIHTTSRFAKLFQEGDLVLLKRIDHPELAPILTKPLKQDGKIESHRGKYSHGDIVGRSVRDTVTSSSGRLARLHQPTLDEYVTMTPRLVTPVYSREANLIVSLLDLHPSPPPPPEDKEANEVFEPIEILEAGTGHGSLTLHLARAIHAANSHLPQSRPVNPSTGATGGPTHMAPTETRVDESMIAADATDNLELSSLSQSTLPALSTFSSPGTVRGATIHTLDISHTHSSHARKTIRNFRHGLYLPSISFNTDTPTSFLASQSQFRASPDPWLTHAILDLPAAHNELAPVSASLKPNGTLLVFCPSVTQIVECVRTAKREALGLWLEQVVEVGAGMSAGRNWDIRLVKTRASAKEKAEKLRQATEVESVAGSEDEASASVSSNEGGEVAASSDDATSLFDGRNEAASVGAVDRWEIVCRPKIGDRVTAGGFIGVWKRHSD